MLFAIWKKTCYSSQPVIIHDHWRVALLHLMQFINNRKIYKFIFKGKKILFMNDYSKNMVTDLCLNEDNLYETFENSLVHKLTDIFNIQYSEIIINGTIYICSADNIGVFNDDNILTIYLYEINNKYLELISGFSKFLASNTEIFLYTLDVFFGNRYESVVVIDKDGKIVYMNQYHEKFLGLQPGECLNKYIKDVISNTRLDVCLMSGKVEIGWMMDFPFDKDLKKLVGRIPIRDGKGKIIGAIGKILFKNLRIVEDLMVQLDKAKSRAEKYRRGFISRYSTNDLIGVSDEIKHVKNLIEIAWENDFPVLITGESGVGKEIVAQAIHAGSNRKHGPFVSINCAAIPATLVESELFGYEGGAFTNSMQKGGIGKFELAKEGVLFLDEIGDVTLEVQAKLLRVIAEKEYFKVGGTKQIKSEIRLITATNKNIENLITNGKFREDLLFRIKVIEINIPPLRERKIDIPVLLDHYISRICMSLSLTRKKASNDYIDIFVNYNWPGNVREFINIIERSIVLSNKNETLLPEHIPEYIFDVDKKLLPLEVSIAHDQRISPIKELRETAEKRYILDALNMNNWNISKTSRHLGMSRVWLYKKINKFGIVQS